MMEKFIHVYVTLALVRHRDLQTCTSGSMQLVKTAYVDRKLREGNGRPWVMDARNSSQKCAKE